MRKRQTKKNKLNRMYRAKQVLKSMCADLGLNWQQELKMIQSSTISSPWNPGGRAKNKNMDVALNWLRQYTVFDAFHHGILCFIGKKIVPPHFVWEPCFIAELQKESDYSWKSLPKGVRRKRDLGYIFR
jgi:hypothetical protein